MTEREVVPPKHKRFRTRSRTGCRTSRTQRIRCDQFPGLATIAAIPIGAASITSTGSQLTPRDPCTNALDLRACVDFGSGRKTLFLLLSTSHDPRSGRSGRFTIGETRSST
ncbi:uncharacterized protein BO97DRAFT_175700 [Aspergillus homomorphus CBS 101889]|uniref:Uncharacterized protein n=1 Tax=Aspergillus homomorphus (strain CBS 101889) TaxID=1450537 RepID=A0A395I6X3_ASPHC|nr:hypothetical protein BO97DRAFT_175700 [Aspergillus homomorphus CBS 101889]RAL15827.1 hypothetical protein BO97DRAFT_175700 [Aspergillus homomorphus CBS 101889]